MTVGLKVTDKLPKYILLVMDNDLIKCINYTKPDAIDIYDACIWWLLGEYHDMISNRKEILPRKAKKYLYPQLFVVALPQHKYFVDNQAWHKMNKCIENLTMGHKEMKVLRLKR